jgi:Flp pilus assembly protein TadD
MRRCCGTPSSPSKLKLETSAKALADTGLHAEAAQALAERAKLSPHNPMIWNDLGVEYIAAGEPDAARKAFLRAHKVFPDYPLPLYNLGRLALGRSLNGPEHSSPSADLTGAIEAIGYLDECLLKDPLLSEAYALLSTAYQAIGDDAQAQHHLQEALRLSPESPPAPGSPWSQRIPALPTLETHPTRPRPFLSSTGKHTDVAAY